MIALGAPVLAMTAIAFVALPRFSPGSWLGMTQEYLEVRFGERPFAPTEEASFRHRVAALVSASPSLRAPSR